MPWLHPCRSLAEIRDRFTEKILFFEIHDFGTKNQQNRDRFNVGYYIFGIKIYKIGIDSKL